MADILTVNRNRLSPVETLKTEHLPKKMSVLQQIDWTYLSGSWPMYKHLEFSLTCVVVLLFN